MVKIFECTLIIIGTIIGAGFSSGQELYKFFVKNGLYGVIGITVSIIIISFIVYKSIKIIQINNIANNKEFLNIIKLDNKYFNTVINLFLLVSFCIMIAGFGSLFKQEFNFNTYVTSIIMVLFVYICLMNKNVFLKLSAALTIVSIVAIIICGFENINLSNYIELESQNKSGWIINAVIYASYNLILTIPILPLIVNKIANNKDSKKIVIMLIGILLVLAFIIIGLIQNSNGINYEMPALIGIKNNKVLKNIYRIVIFLSIFTTSISIGKSFLENIVKNAKFKNKIAVSMCVLSILTANIGFAKLIAIMYPIFGVLGIYEVIKIIKFKA